jgi:hypothetical protein
MYNVFEEYIYQNFLRNVLISYQFLKAVESYFKLLTASYIEFV